MSKIAVLFHKADLDGILSGVIAEYYISARDNAPDMFPCDYDDIDPRFNPLNYDIIYVIDFSDKDLFINHPDKVIWIDHHKSAIEFADAQAIKFRGRYTIDGVAACRLAFQYFTSINYLFTIKDDYFYRLVSEPEMVTLAGEHDIWDQESKYATKFNSGICPLTYENVKYLFVQNKNRLTACSKSSAQYSPETLCIIERGMAVLDFIKSTSARTGKLYLEIQGVKFAAFNTHIRSSNINPEMDEEEATMVFWINPNLTVVVSMYCNTGKDMSQIAKSFGGGGHKGAAGFQMSIADFQSKILSSK